MWLLQKILGKFEDLELFGGVSFTCDRLSHPELQSIG